MPHTNVGGVTTRLQAARRDAFLSQTKAASSANNGNSSQNLSSVSTSSTTFSSRASAAACKAKIQIEAEALRERELLECEELFINETKKGRRDEHAGIIKERRRKDAETKKGRRKQAETKKARITKEFSSLKSIERARSNAT